MGFSDALANLVESLQADADLDAFCRSVWGNSPTVKAGFKKRHEIGLDELPIIRVTNPRDKLDATSGSNINMHTARVYAGFMQDDCELAPLQMVTFTELIRAAALKDRRRGRNAQTTIPGAAVNDEGSFHPTYFTVMEFQIETRTAG